MTHLELSRSLICPTPHSFLLLMHFHPVTVVTFLLFLFISSNVTFFLLLPYHIWLKDSKLWRLSLTSAVFLFSPVSFPPTIWHISHMFLNLLYLCLTSLSFCRNSDYSLWSVLLIFNVSILKFHRAPYVCDVWRRYCIFFNTVHIASLNKTDTKQEKSVLLFQAESWGKQDRKQQRGCEGICPCYIVNCCNVLLHNLNNYYYLEAGGLYTLCTIRKSWRWIYSVVGQE